MATQSLFTSVQKRPLPKWGQGVKTVWLRNFLHLRYSFWPNFCWIFFEPFFYLLAIGYGVGNHVSDINGKSYIEFFFPGLLTVTAFSVAFFEGTYGIWDKMKVKNIYPIILMTPISISEILWGELLWGATKGLISSLSLALVARMIGVFNGGYVGLAMIVLFLISFLGVACGLLFSTYAKSENFFNFAISLFLLPMVFFSDTYFSIEPFPWGVKALIYLTPIIHGTKAVRALITIHELDSVWISVVVISVFCLILTQWAYRRFRQELLS